VGRSEAQDWSALNRDVRYIRIKTVSDLQPCWSDMGHSGCTHSEFQLRLSTAVLMDFFSNVRQPSESPRVLLSNSS
jgi:hypothetical protein